MSKLKLTKCLKLASIAAMAFATTMVSIHWHPRPRSGQSHRDLRAVGYIVSAREPILEQKESSANSHQAASHPNESELEREAKAQFSRVGPGEPGMLLSVCRKNTQLLFKSQGLANLESQQRLRPQTRLRIASLTKQFVAVGTMILVEEGKVELDRPIHDYLPRLQTLGDDITVRHLLNHTSGLPHHSLLFMNTERVAYDMKAPGGFLFAPLGSRPDEYMPANQDVLNILVEFPRLRFETGQKWEYNNAGYVILAQLIEKTSGLEFDKFLAKRVLSPLGMKNTGVARPLELQPNVLAKSYEKKDDRFIEKDYSPFNRIVGDGGLYSTLEDMTRWQNAWRAGKLLTQKSLDQIFAPARLDSGEQVSNVQRGKSYGMGWFIDEVDQTTYYYHGGGWANFRHAVLWSPSHEIWVVVLTNRFDTSPYEQAEALFKAALEAGKHG